MHHKLAVGNLELDTSLIGYVDLDYRVPAGAKRVMVAIAENLDAMEQQNFQRIFFSDNEAAELKAYFSRPENRPHNFMVIPG